MYGLVYKVPDFLNWELLSGMIVEIPLRTWSELGLLIEEVSENTLSFAIQDIKEITKLISTKIFLSGHQIKLLIWISQYYITPIHNALGLFFPRNLLEKIEKDTLHKLKEKTYTYTEKYDSLSPIQENIFQKIESSKLKKHLIYGVTGSGKTQIYIKIIERNLKLGKQTLLLIPEIILTSQIGERVKEVFWEEVLILHSAVPQAKKTQYWMDIQNNSAKIIIGTRSALFYPYNNLASIIIDEQHDESYISDSAPRYNAWEVAEKLCEWVNIELILGSGTPKVETFYRALQGTFEIHQLLEKYA